MYKGVTPPEYDLGKVSVPMVILHGKFDVLSNPTDVNWLLEKSGLRSKELVRLNKSYDFGHNTYFLGVDTSYL